MRQSLRSAAELLLSIFIESFSYKFGLVMVAQAFVAFSAEGYGIDRSRLGERHKNEYARGAVGSMQPKSP